MAKKQEHLSQFYIKIKGSQAPKEMMDEIISITVEDNLHLPDMFVIRIHERDMKWTKSGLFDIGNKVEISAQTPQLQTGQLGAKTVLIKGEITGVEPDLSDSGVPTLEVRGYDRSHRLHQGKRTRSFQQYTDSEIAQKIAQEVNLKSEVQSSKTVHKHITQNNQTNMEFLQDRARRLGYQMYVEDETLYFGPGKQNNGSIPQLTWGQNLLSFRPSMTSVHQVDEVVVRGWDPQNKEEIVGRSRRSDVTPEVEGKSKANTGYKGSNQVLVSQPVASQAEADALAQAIRDEMGGDLIQADGVCLGAPEIKAGEKIEIKGFSSQFDGKYRVTEVIHTYHNEEGYETSFSIGGQKAETLSSLLGDGQDTLLKTDPGRGVTVGIVTGNKDPDGLGRIKVKYPGWDGSNESPWLRVVSPMAGEKRGFYYLPEIDDEVLIAFEQGDINRPYMLGMLWNGKDKPPKTNSEVVGGDGKVNKRIIRSRIGHEIVLDDTNGQAQVTIQSKSGHKIVLDDTSGGEKVSIIDKTGSNKIVIDSTMNEMTIKVSGNLNIEAGGKVTIKGATIDLN